ncbi:integral membrane protein [Xylariales sp. PMI_506]|nr:integral membrane protein [Xylariales sp. PMI_506]
MAPTQYESPIPIENSLQYEILVTSSLSIVVPCLFVGLRFYVKSSRTSKPLDVTDLCVLIALMFDIGLHSDYFLLVFKGGMGFHPADIMSRFGPDVLVFFGKAIVSVGCLYNLAVYTCKIPVLLMYATLIPVRQMITLVRVFGVLFTVSYLSTSIAPFFLCRPLAYTWDKTIEGGSCGNWPLYYTFCGALNITYEAIVLILPMPFFFKLQLPLSKRLILMAMFGVGFATCAIGIYRQTTIPGLDFNDMTYQGIGATVFSGLEPPVAISLSCIPFFRPLFKGKFGTTYDASSNGESSVSGPSKPRSMQSSARHFKKLEDDSSEVELQPNNPNHTVSVDRTSKKATTEGKLSSQPDFITVGRGWEIKSDYVAQDV